MKMCLYAYAIIYLGFFIALFIHFFPSFMNFIGVTLVSMIIQVSGVVFCVIRPVYCTVCPPSKVRPSSLFLIKSIFYFNIWRFYKQKAE